MDDQQGGRFEIAPSEDGVPTKQFYWPETNVLVTRFLSPDGVGELEDFMPVGLPRESPWQDQLIRRVKVTRGALTFRMKCRPAFDYARVPHRVSIEEHAAIFDSAVLTLGLSSTVQLSCDGERVNGTFAPPDGKAAVFLVRPLITGEGLRGSPRNP